MCADARPLPDEADRDPTNETAEPNGAIRVVTATGQNQTVVRCGSGFLALLQVQPAGKRPMDEADWRRGVRLQSGEVLGADEPGPNGNNDPPTKAP